ncbi:MAG: M15 family metallopeptidase [Christensenellaceae bacterium]|nr:M15 family metallopeptidase [Christensenellaceae bacterium]
MKIIKKQVVAIIIIGLVLGVVNVNAMKVPWKYTLLISHLQSDLNRLINRDNLLEEDYVPGDLINTTVRRASTSPIQIRAVVDEALVRMFNDAEAEGIILYAKSGYRSYGTQKTMYKNRLEMNNGKDDGIVAYPGSSEHQSGLAMDVVNKELIGGQRMTAAFAETKEGMWLAEHCTDYGFIIRYPKDKQDITGIFFEPWHIRFVGNSVAQYISIKGYTHEEFTEEWQENLKTFLDNGGTIEDVLAHEHEMNKPQITESEEVNGETEISIVIRN